MSIYQETTNSMYAQDRLINDRVTQTEEEIKQLRHDLTLLLDQVMEMQESSAVVEETDTDTTDKKNADTKDFTAAMKMLGAISFEHDLDEQEIENCCRFAKRIYSKKYKREDNLDCKGVTPVRSQLLAWMMMNYRFINPSDIHDNRFIDGLFLVAECSPIVFNWKLEENDAYAYRWMDQALITSRHSDLEFPF